MIARAGSVHHQPSTLRCMNYRGPTDLDLDSPQSSEEDGLEQISGEYAQKCRKVSQDLRQPTGSSTSYRDQPTYPFDQTSHRMATIVVLTIALPVDLCI